MECEVYFSNIKARIIESINDANSYVWVAVAWITDKDFLVVLNNKINEGVDVKLLVMDDRFNRDRLQPISFLVEDKNLFYRDSHHKYCLIDDKVLITGSFNWTKTAENRLNGENILISYSEYAISDAKINFLSNTAGHTSYIKSITDFYVKKAKEYSYGELASKNQLDWWFSLSEDWKIFFIVEISEELYDDKEIIEYYNSLELQEYEDDFFDKLEIEKIESYALHEYLILILNITTIKNRVCLIHELKSIEPLLFLKHLKEITEINFNNEDEFLRLTTKTPQLTFVNFWINHSISSRLISDRIAKGLKYVDLSFNQIEEHILKHFANNANRIQIHCSKSLNINLRWLLGKRNVESLALTNVELFEFNLINKICEQYKSVALHACVIHDADRNFNLDSFQNLYVNDNCFFFDGIGYENLQNINNSFHERRIREKLNIVGNSEFKFFDKKGNRYKFVEEFVFIDEYGNVYPFGFEYLTDIYGNYVNSDGSVTPF